MHIIGAAQCFIYRTLDETLKWDLNNFFFNQNPPKDKNDKNPYRTYKKKKKSSTEINIAKKKKKKSLSH
jgi:hypothetical protein